jgi:hypothetical protein
MKRSYARETQEFKDKGCVVVHNVLTDADFAPLVAELSEFIDTRARQLQAAGKIAQLHADLDFEHRVAALYRQSPAILDGMDIMYMRGRRSFDFLHNDNLLDMVEAFLGPEITCNPIQHFRAKMPAADEAANAFMNVPWHQDWGVTLAEADNSSIYTFWIPLVNATEATGCMEVMPGCHDVGLLPHVSGAYGTEIDPAVLPGKKGEVAACPRGSIVVMDKFTPHRGLPNRSDIARWTVDLRYQVTGQPTGRPFHPDFVVRSRRDPASVRRDYAGWCRAWEEALENSKGRQAHRISAPSSAQPAAPSPK